MAILVEDRTAGGSARGPSAGEKSWRIRFKRKQAPEGILNIHDAGQQSGAMRVLENLAPNLPEEKGPYADKNKRISDLAEIVKSQGRTLADRVKYLVELLYPHDDALEQNIGRRSGPFPYAFELLMDHGKGAEGSAGAERKAEDMALLPRLKTGELLTAGNWLDHTDEGSGLIVNGLQPAMAAAAVLRRLGYPHTYVVEFERRFSREVKDEYGNPQIQKMISLHPGVAIISAGVAESAVPEVNSPLMTFALDPAHPRHKAIRFLSDEAVMSYVHFISAQMRAFTLVEEISKRHEDLKNGGANPMKVLEMLRKDEGLVKELDALGDLMIAGYRLWNGNPALEATRTSVMDAIFPFMSTTLMFAHEWMDAMGPELAHLPENMRERLAGREALANLSTRPVLRLNEAISKDEATGKDEAMNPEEDTDGGSD